MQRMAVVLVLALAVLVCTQPSQGANLKDVLAGKTNMALTMQLKDVGADWWRMNIGNQSGSSDLLSMYSSIFSGRASDIYYTKGDTIELAGATYLVAYQVQPKQVDIAKLMEAPRPPAPEQLTPETTLSLSLLNMRNIVAMNDIRPFDLEEELKPPPAGPAGVEPTASPTEESLSNLKQITLALLMYTQDWDEVLPDMTDWEGLTKTLQPYIRELSLFTNPITNTPYMANTILSKKKLAHITYPSQMVVFYEENPAADGTRAVAFLDGHAKRIQEAEWPRLKQASKIQ